MALTYETGGCGVSAEGARVPAKAHNQLEMTHYNDEAGRAAYLAALHAAQALIFERTDKVIKRHRGVHNALRRLTRDELRFDPELNAFLGRAYNLKAAADYETGPNAEVTIEQAQQAIETATRFVSAIEDLLA